MSHWVFSSEVKFHVLVDVVHAHETSQLPGLVPVLEVGCSHMEVAVLWVPLQLELSDLSMMQPGHTEVLLTDWMLMHVPKDEQTAYVH